MTRQHQRDINNEPVEGQWRLCATKDESTQHTKSGYESLVGTYYAKRRNDLVHYPYWCLIRQYKNKVSNL